MCRIMIFHGSRCTRDHVFTSIFSVFHVSRFRKKAINVSRLDPFQTHINVWMNMSETPEKKKARLRYDSDKYIYVKC
jgi:hypothetical protein